jgi:hypothetical protein
MGRKPGGGRGRGRGGAARVPQESEAGKKGGKRDRAAESEAGKKDGKRDRDEMEDGHVGASSVVEGGASGSAAVALDGLRNMRVRNEPGAKKKCNFFCGAVCQQTQDPVDTDRPVIRWAYDLINLSSSSNQGANDWYCERLWVEVAPTTVHRDRSLFQSELAKDRDLLTTFI